VSEYRLEPVRTLREVGERTSKGALADAVEDSRVREAKLAAARARVAEARVQIASARELLARSCDAVAIVRGERYVARLRRDLEAAIATELRAHAEHAHGAGLVDLARARVVAARADREVVERHFATWREHQRKAAERKEE
jgi:hypothetical protein